MIPTHPFQASAGSTAGMEISDEVESTDVIICGCGPTGALLSAYLGQMSISNVVLEKEKEIVTDPRGIALDEDGIRLLQGLGIYDKVHTEIGASIGWTLFTSGKQGLNTKPFLRMNLDTIGPSGHVGAIAHKQPVLEKNIREAGSRFPASELRLGSTITKIEEDQEGVMVTYHRDDTRERQIRGKFFVGADGKTGFTRKQYLEPKGIMLQSLPGYEYEETWVAANYHMDLPTTESHPDFPLWKCGFTPQQVYDTFFPKNFRFIGDPDRPSVCGTFGLREERLWRFEFVVEKNENPQEMAAYKGATAVIFPYLTHPGHIYGLTEPVRYPEDCIHVLRSRPFTFSARSCNSWFLGRVILAGDSAHVMPPFGGQGIASGFRDASGIAWRLALACKSGKPVDYQKLFSSWCLERKQHLNRSIAITVRNGSLTTARNSLKIFCRDWILWIMQLIPPIRRRLELGPRAEGLSRYVWRDGMSFLSEFSGGVMCPQVYCRSVFANIDSQVHFTDDVIFKSPHNSFLSLVVSVSNVAEAQTAYSELKGLDLPQISHGELKLEDVCYIVHDPLLEAPVLSTPISPTQIYRIATIEEFKQSSLNVNRPEPAGYDMYCIRTELRGRRYILVRPDRFVFAACTSGKELKEACDKIPSVLFAKL